MKRKWRNIITLLLCLMLFGGVVVAQENQAAVSDDESTPATGAVKVAREAEAAKEVMTEKAVEPAPSPESAESVEPDQAEKTEVLELKTEAEEVLAPKAPAQEGGENLISVMLDDVPLEDVVRMFTRISGANIIATSTTLVGTVTVNLNDVEWKPALSSILDMHNLALIEKIPGSRVYSITQKPASEPMIVETMFLKYASVSNVHSVISSVLIQGGIVSPFPSRNALVVRTTSANMGEVKQIIEKIDKLRDQVFIEAKFMELNDQAIKDLGINWQVLSGYGLSAGSLAWTLGESSQWTKKRTDKLSEWDTRRNLDSTFKKYDMYGQQEDGGSLFAVLPTDSRETYTVGQSQDDTHDVIDSIDLGKDVTSEIEQGFQKTITDAKTAVLGAADFAIILSALKQMEGVTIVSNPKIIVANEQPATIHIGQTERPFIATVTPATQTTAPFTTYNPGDPVDFGVKLTVIPTVNTESNITVRIEPELTRSAGDAVAPNGQTYPIIATKKISTIFCLENGKTVAIGGLTETTDQDVTKKIPLLGDIPIIGKYLFSHTHKEKSQQETIIFVTVGLALPDAIQQETGLPENTELTRRRMISDKAKRQKFEEEIEQIREDTETEMSERDGKVTARLLKKKK